MADKEEIAQNNRIINAEKYKRRIKKGRIYIDVRDKKLNCLLSKVYSSQEAIKRMAKALEEKSEQMARECLNSDPYNNPWGAEDLAEAALNALLEGYNDER